MPPPSSGEACHELLGASPDCSLLEGGHQVDGLLARRANREVERHEVAGRRVGQIDRHAA
eukprot:CAMPEP_0179039070 /NCGR_PEP_ID=MMETSP0796-20121207/14957_1 /TAXON_ID=73915 /ORGANISM="Pyrodinium bahamense, Strain pbaha01" /LENGTH=59 /DNA_ID=CAMNT_0020735403 /DNA_START=360 /DNA_END=539 /DNA_ORIENTATION=-